MNQVQEWGTPPKDFAGQMPAQPTGQEWKVLDESDRGDEHLPFLIYAIGKHTPGLDNQARLVAKCASKDDADLIVRLHGAHRKASE